MSASDDSKKAGLTIVGGKAQVPQQQRTRPTSGGGAGKQRQSGRSGNAQGVAGSKVLPPDAPANLPQRSGRRPGGEDPFLFTLEAAGLSVPELKPVEAKPRVEQPQEQPRAEGNFKVALPQAEPAPRAASAPEAAPAAMDAPAPKRRLLKRKAKVKAKAKANKLEKLKKRERRTQRQEAREARTAAVPLAEPQPKPQIKQQPPPDPIVLPPPLPMQEEAPKQSTAARTLHFLTTFYRSALLVALIIVPVLVAAYYYFAIAVDRYEVNAVFLIRNAGQEQSSSVGSILGQPAAFGRASDESFSVIDYVTSYEGMLRLTDQVDLRAAYSFSGDDPFFYLQPDATLLGLYDYYLSMIDANYDQITGLVSINVRAFRPQDAEAISEAILAESERLVNEFNKRAESDLLRLSREEVSGALSRLEQAESALAEFRRYNNVIDPTEVITRVNGIITQLEGEIALSQAELVKLGNVTGNRGSAVTRLDLEAQIEALQAQVERERQKLVGEQESMGNLIPEFELLFLRKQIAGEAYSASLVSLQDAVAQAQRQQLYVVPVVSPTEPDEAQLPRRWENLFFVFLVSLLVFTIGRLLFLGIRDHIL